MTRFIYITDTHIGANPIGYHQQPAYPERLGELLGLLNRWIVSDGDIDFIIHGGDMVDACTKELIQESKSIWNLAVPVYLVLGNHDLTEKDALGLWLGNAPNFFPHNSPEFFITRQDCVLHVMPNHWDEIPYYWDEVQNSHFSPDQIDKLKENLKSYPDRVHILCTHSPLFGIPTEQTGFDESYHDAHPDFRDFILDIIGQFPQIKCVLSGHNHINSLVRSHDAFIVTGSSFVETPFEFKLIEVENRNFKISTHNLISQVKFKASYDFDKVFVQGRLIDRHSIADWGLRNSDWKRSRTIK